MATGLAFPNAIPCPIAGARSPDLCSSLLPFEERRHELRDESLDLLLARALRSPCALGPAITSACHAAFRCSLRHWDC